MVSHHLWTQWQGIRWLISSFEHLYVRFTLTKWNLDSVQPKSSRSYSRGTAWCWFWWQVWIWVWVWKLLDAGCRVSFHYRNLGSKLTNSRHCGIASDGTRTIGSMHAATNDASHEDTTVSDLVKETPSCVFNFWFAAWKLTHFYQALWIIGINAKYR